MYVQNIANTFALYSVDTAYTNVNIYVLVIFIVNAKQSELFPVLTTLV